ncbi:collagen alpha-1(III) chain-like, partial [Daubentonia madagascariensis]
ELSTRLLGTPVLRVWVQSGHSGNGNAPSLNPATLSASTSSL